MPAIGLERSRWRGARLTALWGRQLFSDVGRRRPFGRAARRRRDGGHAHTHERATTHTLTILTQTVAANANSLSMPFLEQPKNLDGSMAGDVGFDPLGLSEIDDLGVDLYWLREAELKHGRVAMLAATGVIWVEGFGPLPGWPEADGRSQMDVFWDAWEEHPNAICAGIVFITAIELISGVATTMGRATGERAPGDFGLNPLQFEITEELALKEIKHGRLAMWAVMGQIGAGLMTHEPAFGNLGKIFS